MPKPPHTLREPRRGAAHRRRIVSDPAVMGGVPVVEGTRLPARMLRARVQGGDTIEAILEEYPYLDREAVEAAVRYVEGRRSTPRFESSLMLA